MFSLFNKCCFIQALTSVANVIRNGSSLCGTLLPVTIREIAGGRKCVEVLSSFRVLPSGMSSEVQGSKQDVTKQRPEGVCSPTPRYDDMFYKPQERWQKIYQNNWQACPELWSDNDSLRQRNMGTHSTIIRAKIPELSPIELRPVTASSASTAGKNEDLKVRDNVQVSVPPSSDDKIAINGRLLCPLPAFSEWQKTVAADIIELVRWYEPETYPRWYHEEI